MRPTNERLGRHVRARLLVLPTPANLPEIGARPSHICPAPPLVVGLQAVDQNFRHACVRLRVRLGDRSSRTGAATACLAYPRAVRSASGDGLLPKPPPSTPPGRPQTSGRRRAARVLGPPARPRFRLVHLRSPTWPQPGPQPVPTKPLASQAPDHVVAIRRRCGYPRHETLATARFAGATSVGSLPGRVREVCDRTPALGSRGGAGPD